jgi:PAS domain S-box-containing protein
MDRVFLALQKPEILTHIKGLIPAGWQIQEYVSHEFLETNSVIIIDDFFLEKTGIERFEFMRALNNKILLCGSPRIRDFKKAHFVDEVVAPDRLEVEFVYRLELLQRKLIHGNGSRYKSLFENSTIGIYRTTQDGRILMANPALIEMLGYNSLEELQSVDINQNYAPHYSRKDFIEKMKTDGIVIGLEAAWTKKDGSVIYVRESARAIKDEEGNIIYFDGVVEDITEKKKMELQLNESEERFRTAFWISPDAMSISTLDEGRFVEVNESFLELSGYTRDEIIGKTSLELKMFLSQKDRDRLIQSLNKNGIVKNFELNLRKKGGESVTILVSSRILQYQGKPHILTISRNITELKHLQQERERLLQESEKAREQLEEVFGRITDGVVALDKNWNYLYVNDQAVKMLFRNSRDELLGKNIWEEFPDDVGRPFYYACLDAFEKQKFIHLIDYFEPWERWFDNRIYPSPNGVTIYFTEITEQKKTEQELEKSKKRLQFLLKNTPVIIYSFESESPYKFNFISANVESILGFPYEKFMHEPGFFLSRIHKDDKTCLQKMERKWKQKSSKTLEYRFLHKNGQYIWILDQCHLVDTDDGKQEVIGYMIDITKRKLAEKALQKSEKLLKEAQSIAKIGSWELDLKTNKLFWSDEVYNIFEIDRSVRIPTYEDFLNRVHPGDREILDYIYRKSIRSRKIYNVEHRLLFPDGRIKWVRENGKTFYDDKGDPVRTIGTVIDITERKLAELALKENEAKFRSIFEHTGTASIIVDHNGIIINANSECKDATGYTPKELIGTHWENYVAPDSLPLMHEFFRLRFKKGRKIPQRYEAKLVHKDGSIRHCLISAGIIPFSRNLVVNMWDITNRVQIEKENKLLATAMENSAEAIFITDKENRFIYVNKRFEEIYGYQLKEIYMKKPGILSSEKTDDSVFKQLKNTIYSGKSWRGYIVNRKKDGSHVEVYVTISPIKDEQGKITHFISIHRDVTRQKEIERRIQQGQRLEAIGTLAGGIAHDFNNVLTPLLGYTEIVMKYVQGDPKLYPRMEKIHNAALRAKNLIQQILTFSRQRTTEKAYLRLEPLVREAIKLLRASIPKTIHIKLDIASLPYTVYANATEIHQILINLCTNAFQAMPEGGNLIIGLKPVYISEDESNQFNVPTGGDYIELFVRDSGIGIPKEIQDKIFEPYFTTKGNQGGTGLGLSIVHGIINSYKGGIRVESTPGKGTTFFLYFPAEKRKESHFRESVRRDWEKGSGKIMVLDDEKDILNMLKDMLEESGYEVEIYENPKIALRVFKERAHNFNLILSDTTMPEMTGDQFVTKIREFNQEIPIILCTGYNSRVDEQFVKTIGNASFLMKPFTREKLIQIIKKHLENRKNKRNM